MKRIDQQILVTKLVSACTDLHQVREKKLATYMTRNISVMMAISSIHLLLIGDADAMEKEENYGSTCVRWIKGCIRPCGINASVGSHIFRVNWGILRH